MPLRLMGKDKIALKSADDKHIYIFCNYCNQMVKDRDVTKHFDGGDRCLAKKKRYNEVRESAKDEIDNLERRFFKNDYYRKFLSEKDIVEIKVWLEKLKEALLGKEWRIA